MDLLRKFVILAGMLLGLPLLGVKLAGYPLERYLEFPPQTQYVSHAPFFWPAFVFCALGILAVLLPLFLRSVWAVRRFASECPAARAFPWWGWVGLLSGSLAWVLAWNRFSWFVGFQSHTFFPLWFSYILVINALKFRKTGFCMLTTHPRFFLLLFPFSAAFWWFFEYLNRFVQNWCYQGVEYSPGTYFWLATLSFSTVLPAVIGTREWLASHTWIEQGFRDILPLNIAPPRPVAAAVLCLAGVGLAAIGVLPDFLFPLLWVSPFLIIVSLQTLAGESHILSDIATGDWSFVVSSALAALICGGFWEMWNLHSFARWEYAVPLVHRFQIFEMPVLGYAGYLPFGLECIAIGKVIKRLGGA